MSPELRSKLGKASLTLLACECLEKEAATGDRGGGAEPRIGVPLLREILIDHGMTGCKALEHILSILIDESTQAATSVCFRCSQSTQVCLSASRGNHCLGYETRGKSYPPNQFARRALSQ